MKRVINPKDVLRLAYSSEELLPSTIILDSDIVEAECRYIEPLVGETMMEALRDGEYGELVDEYIAPALALWTRYLVEQVAYYRCTSCHSKSPSTAMIEQLRLTIRALRRKASTLTRRLTNHLNTHGDDYPEYIAFNNPQNHCFIYGDIVQIR
ncbi:MAG: hypothetical protein IKB15_03500 [Alistipes sp.]|nr:hypothetical protein [Alistipes sp.]